MWGPNGEFIGSPRDYKFYQYQFTQMGDIFLGEKPDDYATVIRKRVIKKPSKVETGKMGDLR